MCQRSYRTFKVVKAGRRPATYLRTNLVAARAQQGNVGTRISRQQRQVKQTRELQMLKQCCRWEDYGKITKEKFALYYSCSQEQTGQLKQVS